MRTVRFIKIYCRQCDSTTCQKVPCGSWTSEKEGCTKEVSAIDGNKYFHYKIELTPDIIYKDPITREEVLDFMEYIGSLPAGERFK